MPCVGKMQSYIRSRQMGYILDTRLETVHVNPKHGPFYFLLITKIVLSRTEVNTAFLIRCFEYALLISFGYICVCASYHDLLTYLLHGAESFLRS